jgi:hypothetical protein
MNKKTARLWFRFSFINVVIETNSAATHEQQRKICSENKQKEQKKSTFLDGRRSQQETWMKN